jgi:tetratricopeptide (TPR) repeat protein
VREYVPAIGPKLKLLLYAVFVLLAVLGANSVYLVSITILGEEYQTPFYLFMVLGHIVLGVVLLAPFLVFGLLHMLSARKRKNKRAIRVGYALFATVVTVLVSGLLLTRLFDNFQLKGETSRAVVYWLHVLSPLFALWLYWLHRLAGRRINWKLGAATYGGFVAAGVGLAVMMHTQDPRVWNRVGPEEGTQYFEPSLARTASGDFIPAHVLDNNEYCMQCHQDAYDGWFHSAHHFASFNNPAYLASVRETRDVALKRDGTVKAARWCAGCHDPVPFFSGAFDDPNFDDVHHPTAHAGITCTTCHAITHVNSQRGNADYTIEEPLHYPFAFSDNELLQWVNRQLIKAKPEFHKKTFLKDFHKSSEFCSTCHKVHLPQELTGYKEFLRGQNHFDSFLLSGVSGHGARSFYYPPFAERNCNGCHMPWQKSDDFGAKINPETGQRSIHNHLFASGNTGVPALCGFLDEVLDDHQKFLDGALRVDLFGIKEGGTIDGTLHAPLRPEVPTLDPGKSYLLETVIRTLKLGHHFTQGTADSNEVWLDVTVTAGERIIGRSGGMDEKGEVDRWAHFVNVFMLDREGNRINRRNPQDIFTPLYNHQIPPGAGQVVHYRLTLPEEVREPVTVNVKLRYRKFDYEYMEFVTGTAREGDVPIAGHTPGRPYRNTLPALVLAEDELTFPVAGTESPDPPAPREIPDWERWNDYGIGLLLEGGELKQAQQAFREVERLGRYDGPLNLARALFQEGRIDEAGEAVERAAAHADPPAPEWTLSWLAGLVNRQQGRLREAEENFRQVVDVQTEERLRRGFDFSRDYVVLNLLGQTLYDQARQIRDESRVAEQQRLLTAAAETYHRTLAEDPEDVAAHYSLGQIYNLLGETERAEYHQQLHERYKPDENARDAAVRQAREKYPAGNHAAERVVIYPLDREGAPELP